MCAIAAMVHRDGHPVPAAELDRLAAALAHRCEAMRPALLGEIGLAHGAIDALPKRLTDVQPLGDPAGDLWITLDGRIDNREELWRALTGLRDTPPPGSRGDAALLLQAYRAWGDACLERLLGDFVFALWDRRDKRLLCARDPIGIKSLCYHASARRVIVASEPGAIAACLDHAPQPNEGLVAEYLAVQIRSAGETLLAEISRLPPGHALSVQGPRLRRWRYWDPPLESGLRHHSEADCAAQVRQVLIDAVRDRCISDRPVAVLLSGGLDSSSIVGIAASQLRAGKLPCPTLETFSMVFPGQPNDESHFISDVLAKWPTTHHQAEPLCPGPELFAQQAARYRDFPDYPSTVASDPLREHARDRGCTVLISGQGGDEWLGGNAAVYPTLLRSLDLRRFRRELQAWPTSLAATLRQSLPWLLPQPWARAARDLWLRTRPVAPVPWISPDFARRIELRDRLIPAYQQRRYASPAKSTLYALLVDGGWHHGYELDQRNAAAAHLDHRCPFMDRRLIELVFALPDRFWLRRDGWTKPLLRNAMAGLIPESIRQRRDKALFARLFEQSLVALTRAGIFEAPQVVARGWVDATALCSMTDRLAHNAHDDLELWGLWMIAGLELWLRATA